MHTMNKFKIPILTLVALLFLASAVVVYAQTDSGYDLTWWTVDGGGGIIEGGGFSLSGTIGQPEPPPVSTGGGFKLTSGFWPGGLEAFSELFLPLVLR